MSGWIGVDLDGTLAQYESFIGETHIGPPVPAMVERVKRWIEEGREVRIFTARVAREDCQHIHDAIRAWCTEHIGHALPITNIKDYAMTVLYDDRCIQVEPNTGRLMGDEPSRWSFK